MPQKRSAPAQTAEELARVVTGPDPDRFYCPHPGCNRSFAELWRLKVHYRAPPDVRGSGKERGHGTELAFCPKCGKDLRPGKHHVGCAAGKSAPRQAAKRQRQQQMSTTTESAGLTAGTTGATTEATTGSWELAVQRQRAKVAQQAAAQRGAEADSARTKALAHARACRLEQALTHNLDVVPTGDLLFHPASVAHAAAQQHGGGMGVTPGGPHGQHYFAATAGVAPLPPAAPAALQQAAQAAAPQQQPVGLDLPGAGQHRPLSPSPLELFGDPLFGGSTAPAGDGGHGGGHGGHGSHGNLLLDDHLHEDELLRIPSPPPLPADWETAARPGLLFDFDQFDMSKKPAPGTSAPLVTVTTAMNPVDVANPSDDYIWQILFAGENDAVPKRVTAHLHHPPATALSYLDEPDSLLDALLSEDMGDPLALGGSHHHHNGLSAQQEQQQPGSGGTSGASGLVPNLPEPPAGAVQQQQQQQGGHGGGHMAAHHGHHHMLSDAQVVPQPQLHKPLGAAPAMAPYRNGFGGGGPVVAAAPADVLAPAVKIDAASFLS